MSDLFNRLLADKGYLLADGATGTNLFALGLQTGDAPELWNVGHPDRVTRHYQQFIDAGSDLVLTNTFGGNRYRLKLHDSIDRVDELNRAGARLLREAADAAGRDVLVAGDIGPTGEILVPNGPLSISDAADAFAEQAQALAAGGADLLWIETLSSLEEVEAAVIGAGRAGLPLIVNVSIDTNGRTMMGVTAADLAAALSALSPQPVAFGTNCGVGAAEVVAAVLNFSAACADRDDSPVLVAKANCGIPEYVDGEIVYNGTPELMACYARLAFDAGAQIIGGCCGTTPEHISAMADALRGYAGGARPEVDEIMTSLGEVSVGARSQLSGDMSVAAGSASGRGPRQSRRRR